MYVYYLNMTIVYVRNEFKFYNFFFLDSLNNCGTTMLINTTSRHYTKCKLSSVIDYHEQNLDISYEGNRLPKPVINY